MFTNLFLKGYDLINRGGLLKSAWVRRQFARAYFLYKRYVEDPYAGLVRAHPELFRGGHIIDVGANIGYTATVFANAVDPQFKVYAFEPDPDNFAMLRETIARGYQDKVMPIQAAIGEHEGAVELWRNPTNHADHRVWTSEFKSTAPDITPSLVSVPLVNLSKFFARERIHPSSACFVKIDVQGYELPVCLGMQTTLDSNPDLSVALEYAPDLMKLMGFEPTELIELFGSRGFACYEINRRGKLNPLTDPKAAFPDPNRRGYVELLLSRKPLAV